MRLLVARLYKVHVRLTLREEECKLELPRFIENFEFSWGGAWDDFHIYVYSKLKQFYRFKKRYTMTNLAVVGNNKRISTQQLQLQEAYMMLEC